MEIATVGIDLAKQVFHIHATNRNGKALVAKRIYRSDLLRVIGNLKPCLIAMEACGSAHHWGRAFAQQGHTVKLMPAQYVKPYVKSNKNDKADAEAIAEAVTRPQMRFVPVKTVEQQDVAALHRVRERLIKGRTALVNEVHGLLGEYGIVVSRGVSAFVRNVREALEKNTSKLTSLCEVMFQALISEFLAMQERIEFYDERIETFAKAHPVCRKIMEVPGVGPISATAVVAAIGDAGQFKNGRQLSAWLGLVPRQHSTGGKERLLGISKRGDAYLRRLLIQGAHAVLQGAKKRNDRRSVWATQLINRRGITKAAVALANKNARVLWVLMTRDAECYCRA